jgi:hypothetical protein
VRGCFSAPSCACAPSGRLVRTRVQSIARRGTHRNRMTVGCRWEKKQAGGIAVRFRNIATGIRSLQLNVMSPLGSPPPCTPPAESVLDGTTYPADEIQTPSATAPAR